MSTYTQYLNDPALEQGGITLDLGEAGRFVIARAGGSNKAFAKKFLEVTKPLARAIQLGAVGEADSMRMLVEVYVATIMIGWEGVTDKDGQPFPFSKVNAKALFTDLPDLFAEIRKHAEDERLFRAVILEDGAKNSAGS